MKLEVDLPDSLLKWVRERAACRGQDLETCVNEILNRHVKEVQSLAAREEGSGHLETEREDTHR